MSWEDEKLVIAGREFNSRLIVGTGKYKDYAENAAAAEAAGAAGKFPSACRSLWCAAMTKAN